MDGGYERLHPRHVMMFLPCKLRAQFVESPILCDERRGVVWRLVPWEREMLSVPVWIFVPSGHGERVPDFGHPVVRYLGRKASDSGMQLSSSSPSSPVPRQISDRVSTCGSTVSPDGGLLRIPISPLLGCGLPRGQDCGLGGRPPGQRLCFLPLPLLLRQLPKYLLMIVVDPFHLP